MLKHGFLLSTVILGTSVVIASENPYALLQQRGLVVDSMIPHQITLANHQSKTIRLMSIALSPVVAKKLSDRVSAIMQHPYRPEILISSDLPSEKYIGMNGEPVLDQGQWGTCATFATTATINAVLSLTDNSMISQLCNLEVGRTLGIGDDGGWDGSFGYMVLGQINRYGYVNTQYQNDAGCGGLKAYPKDSFNSGTAMSLADFTAHSLTNFTSDDWTPIVAYDGNFSPIDPATAETALITVKNAINQGYRVAFGTLIDPNVGSVGAAGNYDGVNGDTWIMTTQIQQDIQKGDPMEGHEIIIDGYDDNACATYTDITPSLKPDATQCGLLRIRNSWSADAGDKGDYYMTYDHFKGMVVEAYALGLDIKDKFETE